MLSRLIQPHSFIITGLIFLFIWLLNFLQLNMHYLDPFNNGLQDYEITDIVYAYLKDQPTFQEDRVVLINSGQVDRQKLAMLIQRLQAAEVKAIGLDILLSDLMDPQVDSMLHASLALKSNIVLACELHDQDGDYQQFEQWVGVDPYFSEQAQVGFVNFPSNDTKTIRIFSPREAVGFRQLPAFATALTKYYDSTAVQKLYERGNDFEHIFFIGNKDDYIRYEQKQILEDLSIAELKSVLQDKIVLVGFVAEDVWANPLTDRHYTPLNKNYGGKSIPDMYGVVIHANVISMILEGNYIRALPKWLTQLLTFLICYFNVLLIHWIYNKFHEAFHGIARAVQVVEFIIIFFFIAMLFYFFRLRLEFGSGILAILLAYDIIMIYESLLKNRFPILARIPNYISLPRAKKTKTPN